MAPAFIAKGTINADVTGTINPSYPGGIVAGDLLFLLAMNNQLGGSIGTINTPAGWTLSNSGSFQNSGLNNVGTASLFYKLATGAEAGSVAVSRTGDTGGTYSFTAQIYQYRGTNAVPEFPATVKQDGAGSLTVTWDAIAGINGNERTLAAFVGQQTSSPPDTPTGYVESATDSVSAGPIEVTLECNSKENVSSDGLVTASGGSTTGWITFHVCLLNPLGRSFIVN